MSKHETDRKAVACCNEKTDSCPQLQGALCHVLAFVMVFISSHSVFFGTKIWSIYEVIRTLDSQLRNCLLPQKEDERN